MITILSVNDGFKHFAWPIQEYIKRLKKYIDIRTIRPISHINPDYIRTKETSALIEVARKIRGTMILLDERGKGITTDAFAQTLHASRIHSDPLIFIIGGSYGIDRELFAHIPHQTWRISDFVMPHALALLVLLEQIYRANEILKGSKYHHS